MSFILARVMATFIRRKSRKKPISPLGLLRTREIKIISRSCPWNPSTVLMEIRLRYGLKNGSFLICSFFEAFLAFE